jgi:NAD+--dinitrogen-reductase ADP-D-ribosyltransferase
MRRTWNLCDLPAWLLGSAEFNEAPRPFEIQGVRHSNRFLFEKLDGIDDATRRARVFNEYMSVKFLLHQWEGALPARLGRGFQFGRGGSTQGLGREPHRDSADLPSGQAARR